MQRLITSVRSSFRHVLKVLVALPVGVVLLGAGGATVAGTTAVAVLKTTAANTAKTSLLGDSATYASLADAFNNVGTTNNTAPTAGNFDGSGYTYSRQDLAAQGWSLGQTINYLGAPLTWPNVAAGQPDNVIAAGQQITFSGQGATLTLLAAAVHGAATGSGIITYSDDTTANFTISVPDWVKGDPGLDIVRMPHRNKPGGQDTNIAQLFPLNIPLDSSKTVASVTLPATVTGGQMHVFAMGIRPVPSGWTASWGTPSEESITAGPWTNQTLRMVVRSTIGGTQVRLRFENTLNTIPVTIGHATVAIQYSGAQASSAPATVTFNGSQSVTLPAGADVASDPVDLTIPANSRLLVSEYFPGSVTAAPIHSQGFETNFTTKAGGGDHTADTNSFPTSGTFGFTTFLSGVDIRSAAGTVVTLGDSITDGSHTTTNADSRWPNYLSYRLGGAEGVVDEGISGNKVMSGVLNGGGVAAIDRVYRDVVTIPGVKTLILLEGINDIRANVSASSIEAGITQIVATAKQYGITVYVSPILPDGGSSGATTAQETNRQAVNAWIRADHSGADGVIDLSAVVSAGGNPEKLQTMYDSGDHLHPGTVGYNAMANAIDLSLL